jgi:hypothetical protein
VLDGSASKGLIHFRVMEEQLNLSKAMQAADDANRRSGPFSNRVARFLGLDS